MRYLQGSYGKHPIYGKHYVPTYLCAFCGKTPTDYDESHVIRVGGDYVCKHPHLCLHDRSVVYTAIIERAFRCPAINYSFDYIACEEDRYHRYWLCSDKSISSRYEVIFNFIFNIINNEGVLI